MLSIDSTLVFQHFLTFLNKYDYIIIIIQRIALRIRIKNNTDSQKKMEVVAREWRQTFMLALGNLH